MRQIRTLLAGIGGIGRSHRRRIAEKDAFELVACADPFADQMAEAVEEIRQAGAQVYGNFYEMLERHGDDADLAVIATPHHFHAEYSIAALERGLNVYVEKPATVTVQEARELVEAQKRAGKCVQVGFQWMASRVAQEGKRLLVEGAIGRIQRATAVMKWRRTEEYYRRNNWAGRRYVDGRPVWDGVLMNQAIHLVNFALWLCTRAAGQCALPVRVQAELYRLHDIETEDLACIRADLGEGVLTLYATTCAEESFPASLEVTGDGGRLFWQRGQAVVETSDGERIEIPDETAGDDMYDNLARCIWGESAALYSPAEEGVKATILVNAAYVSAGRIPKVSWEQVGDAAQLIDRAAASGAMFSELPEAQAWAAQGEVVEVADLERFDGLEDDAEVAGS